jgi:hypothetical protein
MSTSNQDKGYVKMKKLIALIAVLFSVIVPVQSQAADQKALVIIDSYFDSRVTGGNVSCITLTGAACVDVVTSIPASLSSDVNHGNAMVEVAKKQNSALSIIALAATVPSNKSVSAVNAGNFIDALRWVDANSSKVSAVSFSRYFNGTKSCSPASTNTITYGGVSGADKTIRSLITSLSSKGIPVFVSTGNKTGSVIDYPACIKETVSVSVGETNKSGVVVSGFALSPDTDYVATSNVYSYVSTKLGLIANTTSAGTAAVAATFSTGSLSANKVVAVKP